MECRVEFDYVAQEPDELTIKKGEMIKNVVSKMEGWYEGTLRGKTGVFPDNFVKVLEKPVSEEKMKPAEVVILRNNPSSARRVRVLFSYNPEQDDELTLEVGDVLDFIEEVEEGWWRGKLKGKEGIFPSNFVSDVEDAKTNGSVDIPRPEEPKHKDSARQNHTKAIPDVVPASPASPASIEDEPAPELPPKPVRELARCFYPYKGLNEDELTLSEGDIVTIISKACEDEGWWRGELRGKIGLFPDNFVKIITPGEIYPVVGSAGVQPKILAQERSAPPTTASSPSDPPKAKKDSIVGIGGITVVDGGGLSKSVDKSMDSKVEIAKLKLNRTNSKDPSPSPAPKVGHVATSPISPGIAAFHTNLFSNPKPEIIRKDAPHPPKDDNRSDDSEEFNSVERTETLNHLTATRAKAPKRRPPSTLITRENEVAMMNGSSHSFENSVTDSPPPHHSTPMSQSVTSNGNLSGSYLDSSSMNHSGSYSSQSRDIEGSPTPSSANNSGVSATKPKKQALPWMAELKQTQDKKRGVVLPGAPANTSPAVTSPALPTTPQPPVTTSPAQQPTPAPQPAKESHAKAPPLPAKPSSLATSGGQEKAANNLNHSASMNNSNNIYGTSNKGFPKKSPSPAPPVPIVTNHSNPVMNSSDSQLRGDGDGNSNKGTVTYEEYAALKTRVTSLENEVETLKRQIKLLLDRDLRGHIV